MNWKDRELLTISDLMEHGIDRCDTPEEAQEFMRLYRADSPHADANIGYLSGYYDSQNMRRIRQWFGCAHPIFGTTTPTQEEALEAGKELGRKAKRETP